MSSVGGFLAPVGFVRSIVSSIIAQSTRQIIWPITNTAGNQVTLPSGSGSTASLGGYVPILEEHRDELVITQHPVEQGATISDHAYKLPAKLTLRLGWSSSSAEANPISASLFGIQLPTLSGFFSSSSDTFINSIYATLLGLQINRNLLTVYTARRQYQNLLLQGLSLQTDEHTEHALIVVAQLEEVILVGTQVLTNVPINQAAQANPEATTPTVEQGSKSLQPSSVELS